MRLSNKQSLPRSQMSRSIALFGTLQSSSLGELFNLLHQCVSLQFSSLRIEKASVVRDGTTKAQPLPARSFTDFIGRCALRSIECEILNGEGKLRVFMSVPPAMRQLTLSASTDDPASKIFREIAFGLAAEGSLGYGYEFLSQSQQNPVLLASGITQAGTDSFDERNAEKDQRWFYERVVGYGADRARRFLDAGMIRTVFPVNYLNASHANAQIGSRTLVQEIDRLKIGTHSEFGSGQIIWTIDASKTMSAESELSRFCIA
jgi:hypothetical protein